MLVKVSPPKDFLVSFLQARGFKVVDSNPQVLHYLGKSRTELKILLARYKPDLLINHSFVSFKENKIPQVYHFLKNDKDLFRMGKIYTNAFELCQNYYQKLGLQKEIRVIEMKKTKKVREAFEFNKYTSKFLNLWKSFKSLMQWEC